jgi:hypothetical protein
VKAAGEKLLSLTRISERRPSGRSGAERHAPDVVERNPERVEVEQQCLRDRLDRAEQCFEAVEAVHVVSAREGDLVELDRVACAGRADREPALHREEELVVQRQQLGEAVDGELGRGHGRLGDRIGPVDVLPVSTRRCRL